MIIEKLHRWFVCSSTIWSSVLLWLATGPAKVPPWCRQWRVMKPGRGSVQCPSWWWLQQHTSSRSYDKLNVTNDEINMLKPRNNIQIACRQDEDSRSTRCLLEIKWIKNELSLNPSYFRRFSVILIWRLWSKELSMSIKSILHMTDVLNWHGKQSINDMGWMTSSCCHIVCFVSISQSKHKSWRNISIISPLHSSCRPSCVTINVVWGRPLGNLTQLGKYPG